MKSLFALASTLILAAAAGAQTAVYAPPETRITHNDVSDGPPFAYAGSYTANPSYTDSFTCTGDAGSYVDSGPWTLDYKNLANRTWQSSASQSGTASQGQYIEITHNYYTIDNGNPKAGNSLENCLINGELYDRTVTESVTNSITIKVMGP